MPQAHAKSTKNPPELRLSTTRLAYLAHLQQAVERFANQSAQTKSLAITMSAAVIVLGFSTELANAWVVYPSMLMLFFFWALDARYQRLERLVRELIKDVAASKHKADFAWNFYDYDKQVASLWRLSFTWSVAYVYVPLLFIFCTLATWHNWALIDIWLH